jgi:hypothetical protein
MDRRGVLSGADLHAQPLNIDFIDGYITAVIEKRPHILRRGKPVFSGLYVVEGRREQKNRLFQDLILAPLRFFPFGKGDIR